MNPEFEPFALAEARRFAEARHWQAVQRVLGPLRTSLRQEPEALLLLAEALFRLDDRPAALTHADEALRELRARGDTCGALRAQNLAGVVLLEMGALEEARLRLEDALETAAVEGMDKVRADAATNLGVLHDMREQPGRAAEWYRIARGLYHQLGDTLGEARILHNLGIAHQALKSWDEADRSFASAAELAQSAGEQQLFAFAVVARGEVALMRGDLAAAERFARQALTRFDCHSTLYGLAEVRKLLGMVAWARGDLPAARCELDSAVALCEMSYAPLVDAEVRVERGRFRLESGDLNEARDDLEAAARAFDALRAPRRAQAARSLLSTSPAREHARVA
jgi:tetratricopeptide (TPR) repeat protein